MLQTGQVIEKLRGLRPALVEKFGLTELALFGSYAHGERTPDSDIGVMMDFTSADYKNFLHTIDALEAVFPGVTVQAVTKGE